MLNAAGITSSILDSPSVFLVLVITRQTEQQEAFKRDLPEQVKHIQQAHPQVEVELWCMKDVSEKLPEVLTTNESEFTIRNE
jgi:hypothetical protein